MYCDRKGSLRLGTVSRGRPRYGHACVHTRPRHGTGARGTAPTIRRWARSRGAGRAGAGAGALGVGARAEARGGCCRDAAIRPLGPATRPAPCHDTAGDPATIRLLCAGLGAPVRTWACQLGQLGARAPGSVFFTWFSTQYRF